MTSTDRCESELHAAGLDGQNRTALGRLLGTGTIGHAEKGSDGIMRATVRIPEDELIWEPSILVFPARRRGRAHAHQRRQEHPLRGAAQQR